MPMRSMVTELGRFQKISRGKNSGERTGGAPGRSPSVTPLAVERSEPPWPTGAAGGEASPASEEAPDVPEPTSTDTKPSLELVSRSVACQVGSDSLESSLYYPRVAGSPLDAVSVLAALGPRAAGNRLFELPSIAPLIV